MIVNDRVYGPFDVNEKVLVELLESAPVQRLKNIAQYGVPDEYYIFKNFSRYEHSVGVMLLVRKLGAGIEEQQPGCFTTYRTPLFRMLLTGFWEAGSARITKTVFTAKFF